LFMLNVESLPDDLREVGEKNLSSPAFAEFQRPDLASHKQ